MSHNPVVCFFMLTYQLWNFKSDYSISMCFIDQDQHITDVHGFGQSKLVFAMHLLKIARVLSWNEMNSRDPPIPFASFVLDKRLNNVSALLDRAVCSMSLIDGLSAKVSQTKSTLWVRLMILLSFADASHHQYLEGWPGF